MNKILHCIGAALISAQFCCIAGNKVAVDSTSITDYFFASLEGQPTGLFKSDVTVELSDIDAATATVWNCWREANKLFQEKKVNIDEALPLVDAVVDSIVIPPTLEANAIMNYYLGTKGEKPESGYPFFIYTHGSGPRNQEWATGLVICKEFADSPSVYFIPRIPNEGELYRWWQKGKQYVWENLLRQAMLSSSVNPDEIYIFGISEGGYGSQRLASFYADYLAGAGPMAGGEPLVNAPAENLANTAFSLRTGAVDNGFYRNKLTYYTAETLDSLQTMYPDNFRHWVELIPGRGHAIDYRPTTPWLRQFTRNPYPKKVMWENFEMDGRKRQGFYNLAVDEPETSNQRTRYDLDINGNEIDLSVNRVTYTTTETDPMWGIPLKSSRSYEPATEGTVTIYLNPELVDLSKEVTVKVNGKEMYQGMVVPSVEALVNSCMLFYDPQRVFPASITIDLADLN